MAGELAGHGEANGVAGSGVVEEEALGEEAAKGAVWPSSDAHPQVQAIDLQSLEYLASSPRTDLEGGETPVSLGMPFSARVRVEDPEALQASPSTEKAEAAPEEEALPQTTESIPLPSSSSPRLEESESSGLQANEVAPLDSELVQAEASPAKSAGSRPESLEGPLPSDTMLVPTAGQAAPAEAESQGDPAEALASEQSEEDDGDPRSEGPERGVENAASAPQPEPKDEAATPEVSEAKRRFEEVPMLPPDSFFQSDDLERLKLEAIDEARALLVWLVPGPGEALSPDEQEEVLRVEQTLLQHPHLPAVAFNTTSPTPLLESNSACSLTSAAQAGMRCGLIRTACLAALTWASRAGFS
ncbi:unnamed protein product [Symbiodinium sp. CCMP2456]|nr:unnamed protein product [Symbiodinium sp. CCMP2456]